MANYQHRQQVIFSSFRGLLVMRLDCWIALLFSRLHNLDAVFFSSLITIMITNLRQTHQNQQNFALQNMNTIKLFWVLELIMMLNKISRVLSAGFSTIRRHCQILGVSVNASSEQIKSAYYQKAKEHHPDLNPSETGVRFNQVRSAYQQLMKKSNSNKSTSSTRSESEDTIKKQKSYKQQYAQQNQDYQRQFYNWSKSANGYRAQGSKKKNKNFQNINFEYQELKQFQKAFQSYLRDGYLKKKYSKFKSILDEMFGAAESSNSHYKTHKQDFGFDEFMDYEEFQEEYEQEMGRKQPKIKNKHRMKKLDISYILNIKQEQIGSQVKIKYQKQVACSKCDFSNERNQKKSVCKFCNNKNDRNCPKCKGKGFTQKKQCKACNNKHYIRKFFDELIDIPIGIEDGVKIVLDGRGHQHRWKGHFGDLIVHVNITNEKHKKGKKAKNDQHQNDFSQRDIQISVLEAVLGCMVSVSSKKGSSQIKVPAGVQYGDIIKNKAAGKQPKKIKINFSVPSSISLQQRQIYQKLRVIELNKT